jgi:hypothetical protein
VWEEHGVESHPGPLRQDLLPTQHPQQGPCAVGAPHKTAEQDSKLSQLRRLCSIGPCWKFLKPSSSGWEARPQMLFLRVRPDIHALLGLPPPWSF